MEKQSMNAKASYGINIIGKSMICVGSFMKDSCQGDSGDRLVAEGKLVGTVSFVKGCGRQNYTGRGLCQRSFFTWLDFRKYS